MKRVTVIIQGGDVEVGTILNIINRQRKRFKDVLIEINIDEEAEDRE